MGRRDFLIGNVTEVVDGETISMTVERTGGGKRYGYRYNVQQNIQIKRLGLTDIAWMTGVFTGPQIEKMLKGKQILCLIRSRDPGGSIIADVQLL